MPKDLASFPGLKRTTLGMSLPKNIRYHNVDFMQPPELSSLDLISFFSNYFFFFSLYRVAPFGMKAPSFPAMSTKPDPSERKLKRAATVTYGFERHSKKALLLRWCQKITEDYDVRK